MAWWRSAVLCSLLVLAGPSPARAADDPAACREALDVLDARERALTPAAPASERDAWRQAQRIAALACLGREDAPAPQHLAQPPVRVAPVIVPDAPRPYPHVAPRTTPAPSPPPTTITTCDPAGCWASDGTRWQRNGPDLVGPRGLCTVVGNVPRCP